MKLSKIDREFSKMSTAAIARETATLLVKRMEPRTGSKMLAYSAIASSVGRSATWVRTLVRAGLDRVDGEIGQRLDTLLRRELEAEFANLQREMEAASRRSGSLAIEQMAEVQTHLTKVREILDQQQ